MFWLAVLDVYPGQTGGGGEAQFPVEMPGAPRPQASKHRGAGQGGRVSEDLGAPGPRQGVRPRRGHRVGEPKLALQPRAGRGQGGGGVAVLSHPLGELIEVRADDEGQLGPPGRGLGAGARLASGERPAGAPGRG